MRKKFFAERNVNFINLHYSIKMAAENLVLVFNSIYLYKIGIGIGKLFIILAAIYMLRLVFRPVGLWLALRNGLKKSVIMGSVSYSGLYMVLSLVKGFDIWLFVFMVYSAINDILYWLPFHAYYASLGKEINRGKSVGVREALTSLAGILSPLIGGILIASYGFFTLFVVASCLMLAAVIPLLRIPDVPYGKHFKVKEAFSKISKRGFWLYLGDGWFSSGPLFIWPLIVFLLFNNYVTFGVLFTITILFKTILFLLIGNIIDRGKGRIIFYTSQILGIAVTISVAFFAYTATQIIFFAVFYAFFVCMYAPSIGTVVYNSSIKSENTLWFQYFAENGWDCGSIIMCFVAAWVSFQGFDLRIALILSSLGLVIVGIANRGYYRDILKN